MDFEAFTKNEVTIIKQTCFPEGATEEDKTSCLLVANSLNLNPLMKEITFIERKACIEKNGERYNRTARYDWLGHYIFDNVDELREHATHWLWTYNNERTNTAIGGITPIQKLRNTEKNATINYC